MNWFIRELRRREVFRTAGLYVGICWILIEVSDVLLPIFDAAEWLMRAVLVVAIAGFPLMLVLAWVYNVTDHGIEVQADPTDTIVAPPGSRRMDFAVIGILSVALTLSLYMNFKGGAAAVQQLQPLTVLIADFDNQTGDPDFEGSLEQALSIGMEGASFITAYNRGSARQLVDNLSPGSSLNADAAQIVAVREGIHIIISGSIAENDGKYRLAVGVLRPEDGESMYRSSVTAKNKLGVLGAVSRLTEDLLEDLGDTSNFGKEWVTGGGLTARSLEALRNYAVAQELAISARYEESLPFYEAAVDADPDFGRALSGWALSLFKLARQEQATKLWERALPNMDGMTARERYRTLGAYDLAATGNYQEAIENFSALVAQYPADEAGYDKLAVAYFSALDFANARDARRKALSIYPKNKIMQYHYALYSMYAGDFDSAEKQARELLNIDKDFYLAWLPIAISAVENGNLDKAVDSYNAMRETGASSAALAGLGKADLAQYSGDFAESARLLNAGNLRQETDVDDSVVAATYLVLAESKQMAGDSEAARASLEALLSLAPALYFQVAAALIRVKLGDLDAAKSFGEQLSQENQVRARAYGKLVEGVVAMAEGNNIAAVDALRSGLELADLWLIRLYLGRAYLQAGFFAEAMDEILLCKERRGEASALFLDDLPTWRYMATLPFWLGRAQQELGMDDAARASYKRFLDAYTAEDSLTREASDYLQ